MISQLIRNKILVTIECMAPIITDPTYNLLLFLQMFLDIFESEQIAVPVI